MATLIVEPKEILSITTSFRNDLNLYELLIYLKNDGNEYYVYEDNEETFMATFGLLMDHKSNGKVELKTSELIAPPFVTTEEYGFGAF